MVVPNGQSYSGHPCHHVPCEWMRTPRILRSPQSLGPVKQHHNHILNTEGRLGWTEQFVITSWLLAKNILLDGIAITVGPVFNDTL